MEKNISQIGEFGLIERLNKQFLVSSSVIKGIGDDTAVVPYTKDKYLLLTTDMLVEDVHFNLKISGEQIGRKAIACSFSDIAAMGGVPKYVLVSFAAAPQTATGLISQIVKGMRKMTHEFSACVVGGDTVRGGKMVINVAVVGEVGKKDVIYRCGAREGDQIFVSGPLGRSLDSGRHLTFIPRVKEAGYLLHYCKPHAMIDVSDGLAADLSHILKESRKGAVLYESDIPFNKGAGLKNALYDGEDFELLFTVSPKKAESLLKKKKRPYNFYRIGEILSPDKGFVLKGRNGRTKKIASKGFRHF